MRENGFRQYKKIIIDKNYAENGAAVLLKTRARAAARELWRERRQGLELYEKKYKNYKKALEINPFFRYTKRAVT